MDHKKQQWTENRVHLAGLRFSNFSVTKCKFHTKYFQKTFFEKSFAGKKSQFSFIPSPLIQTPHLNYLFSPSLQRQNNIQPLPRTSTIDLVCYQTNLKNLIMHASTRVKRPFKSYSFLTLKNQAGASSLYISKSNPLYYTVPYYSQNI